MCPGFTIELSCLHRPVFISKTLAITLNYKADYTHTELATIYKFCTFMLNSAAVNIFVCYSSLYFGQSSGNGITAREHFTDSIHTDFTDLILPPVETLFKIMSDVGLPVWLIFLFRCA